MTYKLPYTELERKRLARIGTIPYIHIGLCGRCRAAKQSMTPSKFKERRK